MRSSARAPWSRRRASVFQLVAASLHVMAGLAPAISCRTSARLRSLLQSLPHLIEILQIRRRLIFPGGHQLAVHAHKVAFVSNEYQCGGDGAGILGPTRLGIWTAQVFLVDGPGPGECIVDHGNLIAQNG